MDYITILEKLGTTVELAQLQNRLTVLQRKATEDQRREALLDCLAALDLTSLQVTDTATSIRTLCEKAVQFRTAFPQLPQVASICVFPSLVEEAGLALGDSDTAITAVCGGFPTAQTYIEVKALECAMAEENGADEIDIVLNIAELLHGDDGAVCGEIEIIRNELAPETTLKVIVEAGALPSHEWIRKATLLAICGGADFVKTATGKYAVQSTPEAALVICEAIRDYHCATGKKIGFKAAGGIRTPEEALLYYTIVRETLGAEWVKPNLFRLGASSLANGLIAKLEGRPIQWF